MSRDNPRWGTPRIHSKILMLGINIGDGFAEKDNLPKVAEHSICII
jgi:hypothetical protein